MIDISSSNIFLTFAAFGGCQHYWVNQLGIMVIVIILLATWWPKMVPIYEFLNFSSFDELRN